MDDAKVENELTEEVVQFLRQSGGKVDRHAIKKARIHLLQTYNTDQKRNAGATDKHFAIVQNWVRDFLVEWDSCEDFFQDRVNGSAVDSDALSDTDSEDNAAIHTQMADALRAMQHWTRQAGATPHKGKSVAPRLGKRARESESQPGFGAAEFGHVALRDLKRLARKCSVCINGLKKREDIAARIAQDNPGGSAMLKQLSYKAKVEALFLSHPLKKAGDLCCARYADAFFNMMTGKHTGINFPFSVDAAFVDNLFHLITNLPKKDAWRDRDRGFGHASLMMVKAVGKAAMQRAFKEVWP